MSYDIVVVGGGIGGLTVAALLAVRGRSVCLFERQSQVGGCMARVNFGGHEFDPGLGLYSRETTYETLGRIFGELSMDPLDIVAVDGEYVVRLDDKTDIRLFRDARNWRDELLRCFPECSDGAVKFFEVMDRLAKSEQAKSVADGASFFKGLRGLWSHPFSNKSQPDKDGADLANCSSRFRSFVEAQVHAASGATLEDCTREQAARTLFRLRQERVAIRGGPAALAERLAETIRAAGGRIRLDSPVLRLAFDESDSVVGVDLLSGETVFAKSAVVSNLTIWDTYGKLVGLKRTPADIKKTMATGEGVGVYLIYATMNERGAARLPSRDMICADPAVTEDNQKQPGPIVFHTAQPGCFAAPSGQIGVTIKASTNVADWFTFQASAEDFDLWDQEALENVWRLLHECLPELGGDIEVIETANPRTFYELTRRKLGMVMGIPNSSAIKSSYRTSIPNLFVVGDTVSESATFDSVSESAYTLASHLS